MAAEPDDVDLTLAIAVALGLTAEESVEAAGLASRSSLYSRAQKNPEFYEKVRMITEPLAQRTVAVQVGKVKAAMSAEERISKVFLDSLNVTERLVRQYTEDDTVGRCEECGRLTTEAVEELMEVHKHVVRWASEYAASKAPTRIKHEGEVTNVHVVLHDDTVRGLLDLSEHLRLIAPAGLLPAAEEQPVITVYAEPEPASA